MLNNYIILCLSVLVAFIQSMPTNNTDLFEQEKEYNSQDKMKILFNRDIHDKIDGATHHIKSAGINYRQRVNNDKCFVEYDGQLLAENSIIKIRRKVFRVEDCLLERVYHACGPNLLLMLGVVCRIVEQHKTSIIFPNVKHQTSLSAIYQLDTSANRKKRVITESCCENFCSISELTRYCHE